MLAGQYFRECSHLILSRQCSFMKALSPISITRCSSSSSTTSSIGIIKPCVSLQFSHQNAIAILTLQNPTRRNALTVGMMKDLDIHVQTLSKWSGGFGGTNTKGLDDDQNNITNNNAARVVILTGVEGTFCAGLDLHDNEETNNTDEEDDDASANSLKEGSNMIQHMTRVTNQLLSLPVLSICAVDGFAVGGGAELTTATDLVVLSRTAKIQFVHAKRGASLGWGGGRRLVNKVGRRKALRMLLLGECVYGEEEAKSGSSGVYADAVAEEGETALEAAIRYVQPILKLPCSQSIRAIKSTVSAADCDGEVIDTLTGKLRLDTSLAMKGEMDSFLSVWGGESNLKQIQKAKDNLRGKDTSKE